MSQHKGVPKTNKQTNKKKQKTDSRQQIFKSNRIQGKAYFAKSELILKVVHAIKVSKIKL